MCRCMQQGNTWLRLWKGRECRKREVFLGRKEWRIDDGLVVVWEVLSNFVAGLELVLRFRVRLWP